MNYRLSFMTGALLLLAAADQAMAGLRVQLKPMATVSQSEIRLGDVATVSGGGKVDQGFASDVIVGTLDGSGEPTEITGSYIRIQLALKGFEYDDVEIIGASHVLVDYRPPIELTDADVEVAAHAVVESAFNVASDEVQIRLTSPLVSTLPEHIRKTDNLRAEVSSPSRVSPGQMTLNVGFWKNQDLLITRLVRFDVQRRYRIAVARTALKRGQILKPSDLSFETRFLDRDADQADPASYLGMVVRQPVRAGEVVSVQHLDAPGSSAAPIAIKAKQPVVVVARRGKISVRLNNAESVDAGRVGEVIRVVNRTSGQTITGRISQAGYIETEF